MARKSNRKRVPLKERIKSLGLGIRSFVVFLAPLVGLALVAVAVPAGIFLGYLHVVSTPYFSLDDIRIQGNANLSREVILDYAGVQPGANAFDVDPEVIQERLQTEPWIRTARVEKRLPRTLEIRVEERDATAVLVNDSSYTLLDAHGEPFKQLEGGDPVDELLQLPLITGLSREQADTTHGQELIVEAIELVRLAAEHKIPELSEVHIDTVMGLSIVPAESGIEIRLGRGRYAERMKKLRVVLDALEEEARDVDYILVDQEESLNRVTVGSRATERDGDTSSN